MKALNKYPILVFNIILVITSCFQVDFVAVKRVGNPQRATHLPWDDNKYCNPYWPYDNDCDQSRSVPVPVLVPVPAPVLSPPPVPLMPSLPSIPSGLVFADLRLAVVYPIIQNFKKIITSDPLGITKTWTGPNICSYKGFFCDTPPNNATATAVASIDFNGYGLSAPTLAGFLDQLPDLALFHANSNKFTGVLPPNIAKLRYLYELDLSNNLLTGPFPQAVVGMDTLEFLDLRFNLFTGPVPPSIFSQNLNVLFLNNNQFISTLPQSLKQTHILYLTLANNKFTGSIPRAIAKSLSSLTEVLLMSNALIGCLPYELGLLKEASVLDISHNKLTGLIPFSLACLNKVSVLDLSSNLLYGMLPDVICQLPNLSKLSLSDNYFTQIGSSCRRLIKKGVLDINNNCIAGFNSQRSVLECAAFFALPKMCPYMDSYNLIPCKPHFH